MDKQNNFAIHYTIKYYKTKGYKDDKIKFLLKLWLNKENLGLKGLKYKYHIDKLEVVYQQGIKKFIKSKGRIKISDLSTIKFH